LLFMPMPPERPFAQDLSAATSILSAQQRGQQVPVFCGLWYLNGALHSTGAHWIPSQVSTALPVVYTGYSTLAELLRFKVPAEESPTSTADATAARGADFIGLGGRREGEAPSVDASLDTVKAVGALLRLKKQILRPEILVLYIR